MPKPMVPEPDTQSSSCISVAKRRLILSALDAVTGLMSLDMHEDGSPVLMEKLRRDGKFKSLLVRYGGLEDVGLADVEAFCSNIQKELERHEPATTDAEGEAISKLSDGLAKALKFSPAQQALLRLSLHAFCSADLRQAMDLAGKIDIGKVSALFAKITGLDEDAIHRALRNEPPLRPTSLQHFDVEKELPFTYLKLILPLRKLLADSPSLPSTQEALGLFFGKSAPARLVMSDFADDSGQLALVYRYLRNALPLKNVGVNVLIHGSPGTGKTELVREIAAELDCALFEVPTMDDDKDPLPAWRRLGSHTAAQAALRDIDTALMLFDEVEDVFPVGNTSFRYSTRGRSEGGERLKGYLTTVLETNARPTFWVCNTITQFDAAYLRRFAMVVEMKAPPRAVRERLASQFFDALPVSKRGMDKLVGETLLAPAHMECIASVLRTIAPANETEGDDILGKLTVQTLNALDNGGRRFAAADPSAQLALPYRPDCINTDIDLGELLIALQENPIARLCLYGPPGTGKSAWARNLANALGKPLHIQRASDLLGKYVGESEKCIRHAFDSASRDDAILLIDEVDGLLSGRTSTRHNWENTQVNEMLTSMEEFDGIFVASTNLMQNLDAASARRFDFKVKFDYLKAQQVRSLFAALLAAFGIESPVSTELDRLVTLAPGDFANVFRQASLIRNHRSSSAMLALLRAEEKAKPEIRIRHKLGFV